MMSNKYLISVCIALLLLFAQHIQIFSQDQVLEVPVEEPFFFKNKRDVISLINDTNNEFVILLRDKYKLQGVLSDDSFQIKRISDFNFTIKSYYTFLNHIEGNGTRYLLFTNRRRNNFLIKTIDFRSGTTSEKILDIKLTDERLLETVTYKGRIYLFTIRKVSSLMKVYIIDNQMNTTCKELDFSHFKFSSNLFSCLYDEFLSESHHQLQMILKIQKIKSDFPYPIDIVSQPNKMYQFDKFVYITLDNNLENTVVISINLDNLSSDVKSYIHSNIHSLESRNVSSNSFLSNSNKLFQVIANKQDLNLSIVDIHTDSTIQSTNVFNSSPFINQSPDFKFNNGIYYFYSQDVEEESISKFLKTTSNGTIGISIYNFNNNMYLTLGGTKEKFAPFPFYFILIDRIQFGKTTISNIPHEYQKRNFLLGIFHYRKSCYFNSIINEKDLLPIEGEMDSNTFDKIRKFNMESDYKILNIYISKFGDSYLYAYSPRRSNKFILRKFDE